MHSLYSNPPTVLYACGITCCLMIIEMGQLAAEAALKDAGIQYDNVQAVVASYCYGDPTCGECNTCSCVIMYLYMYACSIIVLRCVGVVNDFTSSYNILAAKTNNIWNPRSRIIACIFKARVDISRKSIELNCTENQIACQYLTRSQRAYCLLFCIIFS